MFSAARLNNPFIYQIVTCTYESMCYHTLLPYFVITRLNMVNTASSVQYMCVKLAYVFWHRSLYPQPSFRLRVVAEFQLFDSPSWQFTPEVSCELTYVDGNLVHKQEMCKLGGPIEGCFEHKTRWKKRYAYASIKWLYQHLIFHISRIAAVQKIIRETTVDRCNRFSCYVSHIAFFTSCLP